MADPDQAPGRVDARYRAFLETVAQIRPKLHRYCARMIGSAMDGEDVVQDALLDAYRRLDSWDDTRPMSPWLFRIAHNRCIDHIRRRDARAEAEDAAAEPGISEAVDPAGPALGRAIEHLVHHLPPKERATVLLKDVFDYTLEEIAALTETTTGAVKAALHRGRAKLNASPPASQRAAATLPGETEQLLRLYVERFNRRDWDGLRALIAADATLKVADVYDGLLRESPYFTRYANFKVRYNASLHSVDGHPAIVLTPQIPGEAAAVFIRVDIAAGQIIHITDYTHCPWIVAIADVSPMRPHAY
jgi:RNA polymerase sigma-70 factor, ECF subfamily